VGGDRSQPNLYLPVTRTVVARKVELLLSHLARSGRRAGSMLKHSPVLPAYAASSAGRRMGWERHFMGAMLVLRDAHSMSALASHRKPVAL